MERKAARESRDGQRTRFRISDQDIAADGARADSVSWARHVDEFREVRLSTISLFNNLPAEAWMRSGIASDNPFTVRALAFITAGHAAHHFRILGERYL
jgi:hypothetical protein